MLEPVRNRGDMTIYIWMKQRAIMIYGYHAYTTRMVEASTSTICKPNVLGDTLWLLFATLKVLFSRSWPQNVYSTLRARASKSTVCASGRSQSTVRQSRRAHRVLFVIMREVLSAPRVPYGTVREYRRSASTLGGPSLPSLEKYCPRRVFRPILYEFCADAYSRCAVLHEVSYQMVLSALLDWS